MVTCRNCQSSELFEVLDMGRMPLAGDFRPKGEVNKLYPLAIDGCSRCGLLQVRELVDHAEIFNAGYSYSSSTVPGLVKHFEAYATEMAAAGVKRGAKLLEIGCNDGVFLEPLRRSGFEVVGIDASENVALMARQKGLDVHVGAFGASAAAALADKYGQFDVVTCSNVFAHNPQLREFVEGVRKVLTPTGEFRVEVHSAHSLVTGLQWDCFYHEHCFYWTIHALVRCLATVGLHLKRWQTTPMHGGALRAVFSPAGSPADIGVPEVTRSDWEAFGRDCHHSRHVIRDGIGALPIRYAYGAAGRAVTLINWVGIGDRLAYVVDGSPLRYGRQIPNTAIPVVSEQSFFAGEVESNEWCFVTAHNYLDGIRPKVSAAFPQRTMRWVTPLPHVTIR